MIRFNIFLTLAVIFLTGLPSFAQDNKALIAAPASASLIKSFGVISGESGFAYTSDAVYLTDDFGKTWREMGLEKKASQTISQMAFSANRSAWMLLADKQSSTLEIRGTNDGGDSWSSEPLTIDAVYLEDADLDNALLIFFAGSSERLLYVPFQTSSNFRGTLIFRSLGEKAWSFRSRVIEPNSSRQEIDGAVSSNGWTLRTSGTCFGEKTGCVQETKLFAEDTEITPPQIRNLALVEREKARLEARTFLPLAPGGTTRISLNRGFDKCDSPSLAQMQTWWNNSPLYDMNIYMSGRNRACSAQPNLSAAWVDQVTALGWGLIPTVVGYQSPCTASTTTTKLSYDPATAEQQGRGEADIAVTAAGNLGLTTGSILYYDMERYDPPSPDALGCRAATVAFLKGWTDRIKELGYKSGVYGSPKNAEEDWANFGSADKMDAIWMARWDNVTSVWTYLSFPEFPSDQWANHQRIKQWQAPHNEIWGGVTFNIDGNISDGPVAGVSIQRNKIADFDGDGKTDISVYRPELGAWYFLNSSNSTFGAAYFGLSTDIVTPGDFDGDGKTDFAVYRPSQGNWYMMTKAGFVSVGVFGLSDDIPVPADYNGDGKTDIAVFRPSTGIWYIANSDSRGTFTYVQFGQAGDKPVPADYDGDGKVDVAVYRPSNGFWYVLRSSDGMPNYFQFGISSDLPAEGDFDGDGKCDYAVYRDGMWYLWQSTAGFSAIPFGLSGDIPATGDYDGDGKADIAVYRPSDRIWYLSRSRDGFYAIQFGITTDKPIPAAYLPR